MPRKPLSNQAYADAIESMVIVCVDVVIIDRNRRKFLLAWRRSQPFRGWWVIGGRVFAGETREHAVARKFKEETELDIQVARFEFLTTNRYVMRLRKQEPQVLGSDTLAMVHTVELSVGEIRCATHGLDAEEYDVSIGLREFDRDGLVREGAYQVLLDLYDLVFPT